MKNKATWIVVGIVFAIILLIGGLFISSNNKAIFLEEQINAAQADINVAEKRRYDLVFNLVDAVQSYQDYEGETMESIVSARNSMEHGDVEGAQIEITAVAEAYPELKANENYKQLMNELALTENQIAQYRNNYNEQVRSYNKMVRSFPNNIILNILGYEAIDTTYTDYDAPVDAPQDLFADENSFQCYHCPYNDFYWHLCQRCNPGKCSIKKRVISNRHDYREYRPVLLWNGHRFWECPCIR